MDYSPNDLDRADAELSAAERRRAWMSDVVTTLRSRNHQASAAERQLASFTAMSAAMRVHRQEIEEAMLARRAEAQGSAELGSK